MNNVAKDRNHYVSAWQDHVRQLNTLAFQGSATPEERATVMNILERWIDQSAYNTFGETTTDVLVQRTQDRDDQLCLADGGAV